MDFYGGRSNSRHLDGAMGMHSAVDNSSPLRRKATDPSRLGPMSIINKTEPSFNGHVPRSSTFHDIEFEPRAIMTREVEYSHETPIRENYSKMRRIRSPEPTRSIGEVMAGVYYNTLSDKELSSEKRIFKLVSILKKRATSFSLDAKQLQMLVEKFLDKLIADKNWSAMTVEKALLLCATLDEDFDENVELCDWFECKFCELAHPPGKYICTMCGEKFQHEVFLQAHKMTSHNSAAVITGIALVCQACNVNFNEDPRQLAIHIREKHMCPYNHIECPKKCGELVVERHIESVSDHIAEKHECSVCHDPITRKNSDQHRFTFHGISPDLVKSVNKILSSSRKVDIVENAPKGQELVIQREIPKHEINQAVLEQLDDTEDEDPDRGKFSKCLDCSLRVPFGGYKCPDCSQMFMYRVQLFLHFRDFHRKMSSFSLSCEICGDLAMSLNALLVHVIKEEHACKSEHLQCSYGCVNLFANLSDLAMHNDEQHEFFCPHCKNVVAVQSKSTHTKNCVRGIRTITDESETPPENLMEKCVACLFQCPQSVAYMCEICASSTTTGKVAEFVDEIEWMAHILKEHKEQSAAFRQRTLTCALCPETSNDDAFDILSFLHHRKMFHSICDTHRRCPNRPCSAILPEKDSECSEHFKSGCIFKFDLSKARRIEFENPTWKSCRNCTYVVNVKALMFCDLCTDAPCAPFVTSTEFALHMVKTHGMMTDRSYNCALCRTEFGNIDDFAQHRAIFHKFCVHHLVCPKTESCAFLFGLEFDGTFHARNDNFCAVQIPHGRKNRTKYCNVCSAFYKMTLINVCYFCSDRPSFVSDNEYLFHLLEVHGRKLAGKIACADCSMTFDEPLSWNQHSVAIHQRCIMHKFCPNSTECFTVFPRSEISFEHACSYENVVQTPMIPLVRPSRPPLRPTVTRRQMLPEPSVRVTQMEIPSANSRSMMSFPPPQALFGPLNVRPPQPIVHNPPAMVPSKKPIPQKSTSSPPKTDAKVKQSSVAPKDDKMSYTDKQKAYTNLLKTAKTVFYFSRANYEAQADRSVNAKCSTCKDAWFLHVYDAHVHADAVHGIEHDENDMFECDVCSENNKFRTKTAKAMTEHRKQFHELPMLLLCPNLECTKLFESIENVSQHKGMSNRCMQFFDEVFTWTHKTKRGTAIRPISQFRKQQFIVSCDKCPLEYKVSDATNFAHCKICKIRPVFLMDDERFWHMATKHQKERTHQSRCQLCPSSDEKYGAKEKGDHVLSHHGICSEHFVCQMNNCFFITSDLAEYEAHMNGCMDHTEPHNCRLFEPGKWKSVLNSLNSTDLGSHVKAMPSSQTDSKTNVVALRSLVDYEDELTIEEEIDGNSDQNEVKRSNWDDMMSDMIMYTDELMENKESDSKVLEGSGSVIKHEEIEKAGDANNAEIGTNESNETRMKNSAATTDETNSQLKTEETVENNMDEEAEPFADFDENEGQINESIEETIESFVENSCSENEHNEARCSEELDSALDGALEADGTNQNTAEDDENERVYSPNVKRETLEQENQEA